MHEQSQRTAVFLAAWQGMAKEWPLAKRNCHLSRFVSALSLPLILHEHSATIHETNDNSFGDGKAMHRWLATRHQWKLRIRALAPSFTDMAA